MQSSSVCKALTILGFCAQHHHWRNLTRTRTYVCHIYNNWFNIFSSLHSWFKPTKWMVPLQEPGITFTLFKLYNIRWYSVWWWDLMPSNCLVLMTSLDIKLFDETTKIPTAARYQLNNCNCSQLTELILCICNAHMYTHLCILENSFISILQWIWEGVFCRSYFAATII